MKKWLKIVLVVGLFLLFFVVRAYATSIFYDPLIDYFKEDYLHSSIPEINKWKLIAHIFFRYLLNTLISLGIIGLLFRKQDYVMLAVYFYVVAFVVLIVLFYWLLKNNFKSGYLLPFYIRRFLIHPLFFLLLLPAFYYQKISEK